MKSPFLKHALTNYDALNEMTVFAYNANQQVLSIAFPNGLISTNIYSTDGHLATNYAYAVTSGGTVYFGTNIYTYSDDLVVTQTDPRGLATTNTWDNLNRLTSVIFPDGTYVSNVYTILDLSAQMDRLGNWTHFQHDPMRRLTGRTNALDNAALFSYCTCGALESVQDALSNTTSFYYNSAGWLTNVVYPAGFSVTNNYDLLGRATNVIDSFGSSTTNWFNNQSVKYAVSNYFGRPNYALFDILDRVATNTDANGVAVSDSYDALNRLLTRTYPDGGVEHFVYNTNGLIAYTNQLTNVTFYAYDAESRKIAETNANNETNGYTYDPAGDLLTLTGGKNQTTTWNYDQFGRVTNKVDAASNVILIYKYDADNRLTNRYSITKGNTYYAYDAAADLTNISYNVSHSIAMANDADGRLTNMVDAIGATSYGYDGLGKLLSEGGLWPNDTVSYTYNNRLRNSLSIAQPNADWWTQTYAYDQCRLGIQA